MHTYHAIILAWFLNVQWVVGVLDGKSGAEPVKTLILSLHDKLVGTGGTSGQGFISMCAKAK